MSFLPQNYEAPKMSNFYMKFQDGENKFRILTAPVLGWEDWNDKKPVRYQFNQKPIKSIDPKKPVKHFWAMVVWNYNEEQIQILHLTQASIRKTIETLCKKEGWGAPYFYDIEITKTGKDMDTEYQVVPVPHKKVSNQVITAFNERKCNLEAVFDNLDPFSPDYTSYTKGIFSEDDLKSVQKIEKIENHEVKKDVISAEQAQKLRDIVSECSPEYQSNVLVLMKKSNITSFDDLSNKLYKIIEQTALEKRLEYIFDKTEVK